MLKSKILIGLTGSIACFKTCSLISQLVKLGHEVQVIATPSALKFVGEATLAGLTQKDVLSDNFTPGHYMDHIHLARWADIFIVAPITAHHINKFALGLADDLLTTLYMAYEKSKPLYLAPAMNTVMYKHFSVEESLKKLKAHGAMILEPTVGVLACGEDGIGKMMEPESIFKIIESANLNPIKKSLGPIIVTFGGTRETIDGVRSIANTSTGETGAQLTALLTARGYEVTALASAFGVKPVHAKNIVEFNGHHDLNEKLEELLTRANYSAVIHLAAVSDFSVDKIIGDNFTLDPSQNIKLGSEKSLTIKLKSTPKIVNRLKTYSKNPDIKIIAFKLTNTLDITERDLAINKLLNSEGIDFVVHNDLNNIDKIQHRHPFHIYRDAHENISINNISELAAQLDNILSAPTPKPVLTSKKFEVNHDLMS